MTGFPVLRLRRLRRTPGIRAALRETDLPPSRLILPVFVDPALDRPAPIPSIPGHFRWPPEGLGPLVERVESAGLGGLLLFGRPSRKDQGGSGAWDPQGAVPRSLRSLRDHSSILRIADVCLCAYTTEGHCGVWGPEGLDNDATLPGLARTAVAYAEAGADWVAPSAMVDGQVGAIRAALDGGGHTETGILAYAAKSASAFYGPFRDAEGSAPATGDRKGYQMDPANPREAMREIQADLDEGADVVMVKPGLPQLDFLSRARARFDIPLAVYHTSGEHAMVKAAAERGWLEEAAAVREILTALRRAGADLIITYHALEAAERKWLP